MMFSTRQEGATVDDVSHIKPDDFKRMQESLKKFSQCMSLGKYQQAQMILNAHREDIQANFPPEHPAQLSVDNN